MPRRYLALVVAAVAVLAVGMYLFHEVRATPASPQLPPATPHRPPADAALAPSDVGAPAVVHHAPIDAASTDVVNVPEPGTGPSLPGSDVAAQHANPKLDAIMDEANKAYDRQDFDEAKAVAAKVLEQNPGNVRMLRILVSSSCIDGDSTEGQKAYLQLPKVDREAMKVRCARYGITFNEQ